MGFRTDNDQGVYRPRRRMMFDNFLGGLAWSAGTIIGGAIILAILGFGLKFALRNVNFVPIVGGWAHGVLQEAFKNQPDLEQPTPTPTYRYPH